MEKLSLYSIVLISVFFFSFFGCAKNVFLSKEANLCKEGWELYRSSPVSAVGVFSYAIKTNSEYCEAYIGLAYSYIKVQNFSESKVQFEIARKKATADDHKNAISIGLSQLYMLENNPHAAINELSTQIIGTDNFKLYENSNIDSVFLHVLLSEAYARVGYFGTEKDSDVNTLDAWGQTKKALELNPKDKNAQRMYKYLMRNEAGLFTELIGNLGFVAEGNSQALADFDNDGDNDLIINGYYDGEYYTKLYLNDGQGSLSKEVETFSSVSRGNFGIGDVDHDGDIDVVLMGGVKGYLAVTKIYVNNGHSSFKEVGEGTIKGVYGKTILGDVDGDGDLDVMVAGELNSTHSCLLYINNGKGSFSKCDKNEFFTPENGDIVFADFDNDSDLDIIISGYIRTFSDYMTIIYLNDGEGAFSVFEKRALLGVSHPSLVTGDIDNDGDIDLLLSGNIKDKPYTKIFRNNGSAIFSEITPGEIADMWNTQLVLADVDGDSDLDLLTMSSGKGNVRKYFRIFLNDGNGNFYQIDYDLFIGRENGYITAGDINGDGCSDVIITGFHPEDDTSSTKLLISKGKKYFND